MTYLGSFENLERIIRIEPLCRTLADNSCPLLTITQNVCSYPNLIEDFLPKRKPLYIKDKLNSKLYSS